MTLASLIVSFFSEMTDGDGEHVIDHLGQTGPEAGTERPDP